MRSRRSPELSPESRKVFDGLGSAWISSPKLVASRKSSKDIKGDPRRQKAETLIITEISIKTPVDCATLDSESKGSIILTATLVQYLFSVWFWLWDLETPSTSGCRICRTRHKYTGIGVGKGIVISRWRIKTCAAYMGENHKNVQIF